MKKNWLKHSMQLVLALVLSTSTMTTLKAEEENKEFTDFLDNEFIETMEGDYLSLHYTLKDYSSWNIEKPEVIVGEEYIASYQEAIDENNEVLKKLESFDYNSLSEEQKYDYDVIKAYLQQSSGINAYPMLDAKFNPNTGVLDNIITNFEEFVFYKKEDIDDYLTLLPTIRTYLEGCLDVTALQVNEGIFLSDSLLDESLDFIDGFTSKVVDNAMVVSFDNKIDEFVGLSEEQKEEYKQKNLEAVQQQVIPAYQMVADKLETWHESSKYSGGLYYYPNGKEYYANLAKSKSSTNKSVEELLKLCEDYVNEIMQVYMELYIFDQDIDAETEDASTGLETAEEVLTYLQNHLEDYPTGPKVSFKESYLDPTIANPSIVAYYMQPPVDDISNNVIKINGDNIGSNIDLYGTLAHEGFPGHLYQITWFIDQNAHPIRQVTSSIGYLEGWAMYGEFNAYINSPLEPFVGLNAAVSTGLGYVLDAYVDLGVNGLGWTVDDVADHLRDLGLNPGAAEDLYDFVISKPGLILPYGVGMAYMQKFRGKVYAALGDDFDVVEFNKVILTHGDRPFELVEKDVDNYIRSKGKEIPTDFGFFVEYEDKIMDIKTGTSDPTTGNYQGYDWNNYSPLSYIKESKWPYYLAGGVFAIIAVIACYRFIKNEKKEIFRK
ncbi:MAG: DUF885 domain-containing protein [Solobacterium sp.]|nr:DUF885 domain-containing protein [Solobacterium sp.]